MYCRICRDGGEGRTHQSHEAVPALLITRGRVGQTREVLAGAVALDATAVVGHKRRVVLNAVSARARLEARERHQFHRGKVGVVCAHHFRHFVHEVYQIALRESDTRI